MRSNDNVPCLERSRRFGNLIEIDPLSDCTARKENCSHPDWTRADSDLRNIESNYSSQPLRYSRRTYCAASGAFLARIAGPSHSSFLPVRRATQPSKMISVRYAAT